MRVISWNVQGAARRRIYRQVDALSSQHADVVALQEVTHRWSETYRELLNARGFPFVITSFDGAATPASAGKARSYGELLASRWPLSTGREALDSATLAGLSGAPWPERILAAVIHFPPAPFEIYTVYTPNGSNHKDVKTRTFDAIYVALAHTSNHPRVLCGDFNTPQDETSDGRVVTWAYRRREDGIYTLRKDRGEAWDASERRILCDLADYDLPDVYRLLHGYTVEGFSYRERGGGHMRLRRFDHMYASRQLDPSACEYLHGMDELSDHTPIEADFGVQ